MASNYRLFKRDVPRQPKSRQESDRESKDKRGNMGGNSNRADINYIMAKDKIVKYKI